MRREKLHLSRCGLLSYAHGEYFAQGRRLGGFGYSVRKRFLPENGSRQKNKPKLLFSVLPLCKSFSHRAGMRFRRAAPLKFWEVLFHETNLRHFFGNVAGFAPAARRKPLPIYPHWRNPLPFLPMLKH